MPRLLSKMMILRYAVAVSAFVSLSALTYLVFRTLTFGRKPLLSRPQGNPYAGIAYALGRGMMPWEKESASQHLPTYMAGIGYHFGIFAAIFYALILAVFGRLSGHALVVLRAAMAAGFALGAGLLLKRALKPPMRFLSCADDYASNVLVDLFLLLGVLATFFKVLLPAFLVWSILVFLYMPLGKIRHCFFFFYSRILFGSYFGRRGVLPRRRSSES